MINYFFFSVSLAQLVRTMHNICKVRSSNPATTKKYFFWIKNYTSIYIFFCIGLVARAHTIKYGEVKCPGFELRSCINYAMSYQLSEAHGGRVYIFYLENDEGKC